MVWLLKIERIAPTFSQKPIKLQRISLDAKLLNLLLRTIDLASALFQSFDSYRIDQLPYNQIRFLTERSFIFLDLR